MATLGMRFLCKIAKRLISVETNADISKDGDVRE